MNVQNSPPFRCEISDGANLLSRSYGVHDDNFRRRMVKNESLNCIGYPFSSLKSHLKAKLLKFTSIEAATYRFRKDARCTNATSCITLLHMRGKRGFAGADRP
jgi:hypothetical protein